MLRRLRAFAVTNGACVCVAVASDAFTRAWDDGARQLLGALCTTSLARIALFTTLLSLSARSKAPIRGQARKYGPSVEDEPALLAMAAMFGIGEAFETFAVYRNLLADYQFGLWSDMGLFGFAALFVVFIFKSFLYEVVFDFFHYITHRICHQVPQLYGIHKTHHKYLNPTPLSTFHQDPVDIVLTNVFPSVASVTLLRSVFGVTFDPLEYSLLLSYKTFIEIAGHAGVETSATSFPQCAALPKALGIELRTNDHDLHHSRVKCNYSKRFTLWDKVFGTFSVEKVAE